MSHTSKILASAFAATSAVVLALISNTEASPTPLADPTPPPVAPQLDLSGSGYVASPGSPEVWGEPLGAVSAASVPGDDPGVICRFINFEGLGNRRSIPVFDGIQSPGWLSLIDLDSGGTGNFANEPSPSTVAFWRADPPGSRDILFSRAVSQVGFRYASAVTVVVEAFDSGGGVVDSATGAPNYLQGPGGDPTGGFDKWDPIQVTAAGNRITRVRVSGNVNQTGIDDLLVCHELSVYGVEFTQATQELQTVDELSATLDSDGEPPVPIIARKPAVARVYLSEVPWVTKVRARLTIGGMTPVERSISLRPSCLPRESRDNPADCASAQLYFLPPTGSWTATVEVFDSSGRLFEAVDFPITSRNSEPMRQVPVTVCALYFGTGDQTCGDGSRLGEFLPFLRLVAPTYRVATAGDLHTITVPKLEAEPDVWWWENTRLLLEILRLIYGPSGTYYHGLVAPDAPAAYNGIGLPRSAASRILDTTTTTVNVAHESGHMLGRNHTGTPNPQPPCFDSKLTPWLADDWPHDNNLIQETGFDLVARDAVDPDSTYDLMGYCDPPDWVSPHTYRRMMEPLGGTAFKGPGTYAISTSSETTFWLVRGRIEDGSVAFEPLFLLPVLSEPTPNGGAHSLQVRDSTGAILSETAFEPLNSIVDPGDGPDSALFFSVLARFNPAAASIVVLGPGQEEMGRVSIQGAPPTVAVTSPASGAILAGTVEIAWNVDDPDTGSHATWIEYSPDGGSRRIALATGTSRSSIAVDFDKLPGCSDNCRLWIQTSDGMNTGSAAFSEFTVPAKGPTGAVIGLDGSVIAPSDLLWLQALAHDPDDGYLSGSSVQWTSSMSGQLGEGDDVAIIGLAEGEHHISTTITDSDGNSLVDTFDVLVDGTEPSVQLSVLRDGLAARCVDAAFSASDEAGGSGLASIRYSLDGGESWTDVPASDPQRSFTVPGSGYFNLIVEAKDRAGNSTIEEETFFTSGECAASLGDFVLLGEQGVWVEQNAAILGGDVGANVSSTGPYLAEGSEVTIGLGAVVQDVGTRVMGDTVYLKDNSRVYDVYYNELAGLGDVLADRHTPVQLPLVSMFPDVPSFSPGSLNFDVPQNGSLLLDPGSYALLKARRGATITFSGGVYDFSAWDVGENVVVNFLAPTEIRIAGRLSVEQGSYLGPAASSTDMDATDMVIYVTGINGSTGYLGATPKAAKFGIGTEIHANVYVPNGTLWLRQNGRFTGAFLARWVDLGIGASVQHLSHWGEGSGE